MSDSKFAIRMPDGGYFQELDQAHNLVKTDNIEQARQFDTQWDALKHLNVLNRSDLFANAKVVAVMIRA